MGIDIRDGLQMECIACGLCVDACNNIMDKVGLERGLIRYDTTNHMEAEIKGGQEKFKFLRVRTIYYASILALVGGVMLYSLITRAPLQINVLHDRNPVFVQLSNGDIRNGYTLKILNKTHEHREYNITVNGVENAQIKVKAAGDVTANNLYVPADSVGTYRIFVSADVVASPPRSITFTLTDNEESITDSYKSVFISERNR